MPIDLSQVCAHKEKMATPTVKLATPSKLMDPAQLPTSGREPVLVESVALKKSWSKEPGYWVELVYTPMTRQWAVRKRWSWYNKNERKQVEGEHTGYSSRAVGQQVDAFKSAIGEKLARDYTICGRRTARCSPLLNVDLGESVEEEAQAAQVVAETMRRKPKVDWW